MPNPIMDVLYGNPLQNFAQGGQPGATGGLVGALMGQGAPGGQPNAAGAGGPPMAPAQATQSPQDLVRLYAQLEQRNRAEDMFNAGAANLVASKTPGFKAPVMPGARPDAGSQLQTLMQAQYYNQMMAARPAIIQALTGGGGGGLEGTGGGPSGGGGSLMSPDVLRTLPPDVLEKMYEGQVQRQAESGIAIRQKAIEERNTDLLEARTQAPKQIQVLKQADDTANQIKTAMELGPDGKTQIPVLQAITSDPMKISAANTIMNAPNDPHWYESLGQTFWQNANLSPEEKATLMKMKQLNLQLYGAAFEQTGSKRTGQEVKNLQGALSPLGNLNQKYSDYMKQYQQFQSQIHKSIGANFGASQELDAMPEEYRWDENGNSNVDQSYAPGGALYEGRGGEWTKRPPKVLSKDNPDADWAKLNPGDLYIGPDGNLRRK